MTDLTKHITQLAKDNFIKIDDQQKVLQIVREALLLQEKEKTHRAYCEICRVFIDADTGKREQG